jgi:microcystin degradation protein MlrC
MTFHVLTAEFIHESNTFKKGATDLRDFSVDTLLEGDAAIARRGDVNAELAGFLDVAKAEGWRVTHAISAHATPGARVARAAFEHIAECIYAAALAHKDTLDGILLGLHGSMVPDFCEDGEGELLSHLRAIVGPDLPIAVTLDLHAMVTPDMARLAQIYVSYKTYPHVDMRVTARHAARLLGAAMAGAKPATVRVHVPMLDEANGGRSDVPETQALYERAIAHEAEPGILAVSINSGFAEADITHMGPTILVTHEGQEKRAREIAKGLAETIWAQRHRTANEFLTVEEAAAFAKSFDASGGPLLIADYADNPGAGAYGDATNLLRAMLEAGVENASFSPMVDGQAAAELHRHKVGDVVTLQLGGKCDASFGGEPLEVTGEILHLSDGYYVGDGPMMGGVSHSWGPVAVLRVGGVDILITTETEQMLDQQQLKAFGIEPAKKAVVALKSMQHFRAAFQPIAGKVIVCDSGALATPQAHKRPYVRVPRPVWPLDRDMEFVVE